ncbi:MAG: alpha/beta hydrolase [Pseudomonadales bacterium]
MDLHALFNSLKPLDFENPHASSAAQQEYFRFYGIDFENRMPDLQHFVGSFTTTSFNIVCHYFRQQNTKGTCYVVHGYYDHVGLFGNVIEYWLLQGFSVIAFDLPGHGLSTGPKATISSFTQYNAVLEKCIDLSSEHNAAPYHIVGQSTGATIVMQHLLQQEYSKSNSPFQHIVLLAPLVRPAFWPFSRVLYYSLRPFIDSLPRRFAANSNDADYLEFVRGGDPLQPQILPVQWVSAMRDWIGAFENFARTDLEPLIVQGQQDRTVDWRFNIKVITEKFPASDVFDIEEGRHHLANESEEIRRLLFGAVDRLFEDG